MALPPVARFVIEVRADGDGIAGTVSSDGGRVAPFSGWLELLALLEVPTEHGTPTEPVVGSELETDHI